MKLYLTEEDFRPSVKHYMGKVLQVNMLDRRVRVFFESEDRKLIFKASISYTPEYIKVEIKPSEERVEAKTLGKRVLKLDITRDVKLEIDLNHFSLALNYANDLIWVESEFNNAPPIISEEVKHSTFYGRTYDNSPLWCLAFYLAWNDHVYGLGESFGPLDKRGTRFICYARDPPFIVNEYSYIPIPFIWSIRGWGLLLDTTAPSYFDIGSYHYGIAKIYLRSNVLRYYLFWGKPLEILRKFYKVVGLPKHVPPKWSFGFWISRCAYRSQDEVLKVAYEFRKRKIPCDVIHIDPPWQNIWRRGLPDCINLEWDHVAFPNPKKLISELHKLGFKLCLWINPYLDPESKLYREAKKQKLTLRRAFFSEATPDQIRQLKAKCKLLDLTNPKAYQFFKEKLKEVLRQGVDVLKSDYGEAAPRKAQYHKGLKGEEAHNLYPLLYQKAVYEATLEEKGYGLIWGRSGYTGIHKYPLQWSGDTHSSWQGIYTALRGLLSFSCSGAIFASFDIGGFLGKPTPKLYLRWLQFGMFISHPRAHGKSPREPWEFGKDVEKIAVEYLKLRYKLTPYIYSESIKCIKEGKPLVRSLVMEYPDDPTTWQIDHEYLFGSSILVAPILDVKDERVVYLPENTWYYYWSDRKIEGKKWINIKCSLNEIPVFIKSGSIIPMLKEAPLYLRDEPWSSIVLHVYPDEDDKAYYKFYDINVECEFTYSMGKLEVKIVKGKVNVDKVIVHKPSASKT